MATRPISHKEQHPDFKGGGSAPTAPPYDFEGVTLRYFPLKANFHTLANFCDDYLNMAPDFARFRPAMPYVLLIVVNYGRMSQQLGNLGWTSQNELLFTVPVDWYRVEDGKSVYHSMATVAPFIFVDNDSSQSAGREILGWPKGAGWFTRDIDSWARHPRNRREVLTLTTRVFDELYEGESTRPRELLVIEEDPGPTFTEFPPDPHNPLNPLLSIPRAMAGWSSLAMRGLGMFAGLRMRGYSPELDLAPLARLRHFMQSKEKVDSGIQGNTINLKQMRDASFPDIACYQAITNAKMEITQFHKGGMLGDAALLRGDTSGGYRIRLNCFDSQPIISVLGLEVEEDATNDDDVTTSILRPVLPFWQEMDMRYLEATNVCWRTSDLDWRSEDKVTDEESTAAERKPHLFNTTGPAALQVATGPFTFINATIRVLPLLADPAKLQQVVNDCLPSVKGAAHFEAYGSYVYLLINNFGKMYSETNDVGRWADKTVDFVIPVRWRDEENGKLKSVGYFCPYMFNSSSIGVMTGREVYGWPVAEAQIKSPRNVWLDEGGPMADIAPCLDLKAQVFPALNVGQESEWRKLIEVDDGNLIGRNDTAAWNAVADGWGRATKTDIKRMTNAAAADEEGFLDLRTLALEILGNGKGLNQFSFKQFRDAASPDKACYQALVRRHTVIDKIKDLRELEDRIHVKIHHYPTHPIVEALGLVTQSSYVADTGRIDCLQPSRHFYLCANLRTESPENICTRSLAAGWNIPPRSTAYFEESGVTGVSSDLTRFLDDPKTRIEPNPFQEADENPRRLRHKSMLMNDCAVEGENNVGYMQKARATEVINNTALEPQMVIHSILSKKWENRSDPDMDRIAAQSEESVAKPRPTFVVRRDSVGPARDELFPQESDDGHDVYWTPDADV